MNKKIMFVPSDNNATSGAFLSMVKLCTILKLRGYDILVLLHCNGNGEELLKQHSIRYIKVYSFNWFIPYKPKSIKRMIKKWLCYIWMPLTYFINKLSILKIEQIIEKEKIDIIHINTSCTYVAAISAIHKQIPFVWHIREFLEEDQERTIWNKKLAKKLMNSSSAVITISNSLQKKYKSFLDNNNIYRVYNGIDSEKFSVINRKILQKEKISLLMVGSINKDKGQPQAIDACKELLEKNIRNFE